jgi:hypothetical protein
MVELTQEEQRRLRKDLIALDCAAALAYERLFGQQHRNEFGLRPRESGNALASALAARLPVYTHNEALTEFRRFDPPELQGALFDRGGREMRLADGRAVVRLVIRLSDLQDAIANPRTLPLGPQSEPAAAVREVTA